MVKAEVISNKSTKPAPSSANQPSLNPAIVSGLIIVVAVAALIVAIMVQQSSPSSTIGESTPAATSAPLSVRPANSGSTNQATGGPSVQAAAGASSEAINGQSPLNNTGTTPDASQGTDYNQQTQLNDSSLNN